MCICITKISVTSMAQVKERLNNKAITKNFTNVVVQIISTLILFPKITNALSWVDEFFCRRSPYW